MLMSLAQVATSKFAFFGPEELLISEHGRRLLTALAGEEVATGKCTVFGPESMSLSHRRMCMLMSLVAEVVVKVK